LVGTVYQSPNSTHENNKKLIAAIQSLQQAHYSHILIMGDFNYLHINWESLTVRTGATSDSQSFIDAIQDALLTQHITSPTRYRFGQHPSTLDVIFTMDPNTINKLTHLAPLGQGDYESLVCMVIRLLQQAIAFE